MPLYWSICPKYYTKLMWKEIFVLRKMRIQFIYNILFLLTHKVVTSMKPISPHGKNRLWIFSNFHVWNLRIANLGIKSLVDDNPCIRTLLGTIRVYEHHKCGAGYTIVRVLVMIFDCKNTIKTIGHNASSHRFHQYINVCVRVCALALARSWLRRCFM